MNTLPYFFYLLNHNKLIQNVVTIGRLSPDDMAGSEDIRRNDRTIIIKNFSLNDQEFFKQVNIFVSTFGTLTDFVSDEPKYFEDTGGYFNTKAKTFHKPPYIIKGQTFAVQSKRLRPAHVFEHTVQGTVLRSDLFGCKIMLSFYK